MKKKLTISKAEFSLKNKDSWTTLCLRIPKHLVTHVDSCVETRIGMTRTGWILEAIADKIKKESGDTSK